MIKDKKMKCSDIYDDLFLYAEGTLPDTRIEIVEEHISKCSQCMNHTRHLKESFAQINNEAQTVADNFFYTRLLSRIEKEKGKDKNLYSRLLPKLAVAAVFIGAIAGGLRLGRLYSVDVTDYNMVMNQETMFLDELKQEPIESFFITPDTYDNEQN